MTPLAMEELNGPGGEGYQRMIKASAAGFDSLVMRSFPSDTPLERAGWLSWADQDCSCILTSLGLTYGLIRVGSGPFAVSCRASAQARPDPTERV
jgi:hypothetical protein